MASGRRPRRAPGRGIGTGWDTIRRVTTVNPPIVGLAIALGGLLAAIGTALPWYAPNLASAIEPLSVSGLGLGWGPRAVLIIAILLTAIGVALAADESGLYPLDRGLAWQLTLAASVLVAAATVLVAYRLLVLPAPADFHARRYGLYLTALGVASAGFGSATQVLRRSG